MHIPGPPPVQKKPTPWAAIAVILAIGVLTVGGLCAYGGYIASKYVKGKPQPREFYGEVREIEKKPEGWAVYDFREVPMTVQLPSKPEKGPLEYDDGDFMYTTEWTFYSWLSDVSRIEFIGEWYRYDVDLAEEDEYINEFAASSAEIDGLSLNFKVHEIGSLKGRLGTAESKEEEAIVHCFVWAEGRKRFAFLSYHDIGYKQEAADEFKKIINSIQVR